MDKINKLIRFEPVELDKIVINNICDQVIDLMSILTIPQKAYALKQLVDSFEEVLLSGDYKEID